MKIAVRFVDPAVKLFPFQDGKEGFRDGVVVGLAGTGKRLLHAVFLQKLSKCIGSKLRALIAVKQQVVRAPSFFIRFSESGSNKLRRCALGNPVSDHAP